MTYDAILIGGGVSGMVASIVLARKGYSVAILEKSDRLGKKILATGNGKCNIMPSSLQLSAYNSGAVATTFDKCSYDKVCKFWQSIGVVVKEVDGRCYPYSMQASSVLNALRLQIEKLKIAVFCGQEVQNIAKKDIFSINNGAFKAKNIVFSTGSNATFGTDSLLLAKNMGLSIKQFAPSLVPILTDTQHIKGLKGVRAECGVTLQIDGVNICTTTEEIIFKDNGLSGSAIFEASAYLARQNKGKAQLLLNFMPDKSLQDIEFMLNNICKNGHMLEALFHKEICNNLIKRSGVAFGKDNHKLAQLITKYPIAIKSLGAVTLAQVMSGGISLAEIDMATMAIKKIKGCYVAGEVADIDGVCGGHNLLWATASAIVVGENIC